MKFSDRRTIRAAVWFLAGSAVFFTRLPAAESPPLRPLTEYLYDLHSGKYLGQSDRLAVHLDPWQPALFALLPQWIPGDDAFAALTKLADAAK